VRRGDRHITVFSDRPRAATQPAPDPFPGTAKELSGRPASSPSPYPVDYRTTGRLEPWLGFDVALRLHELDVAAEAWTGLAVYRLAGRIQVLLPRPSARGARAAAGKEARCQFAMITGSSAAPRMWLVAPPKIIWRRREWV
jgi:hypothetical protein